MPRVNFWMPKLIDNEIDWYANRYGISRSRVLRILLSYADHADEAIFDDFVKVHENLNVVDNAEMKEDIEVGPEDLIDKEASGVDLVDMGFSTKEAEELAFISCGECKKLVPTDALFCPYCGIEFEDEDESEDEDKDESEDEDEDEEEVE